MFSVVGRLGVGAATRDACGEEDEDDEFAEELV
jgi:hypothetical protein